jgi:16S rRNA (guanine1207-N2)-methyltransferase
VSQAARALTHAFETGALALPPGEKRAFFLRAQQLPLKGIDCEQSFRPEFLKIKGAVPRLDKRAAYAFGLVMATKHKEENFANVARGWDLLEPGGVLACAGSNDDGAASLEKHVAKALGPVDTLSKFHSRVFWFAKGEAPPPAYWRGLVRLQPVSDSRSGETWLSQPGIFSWNHMDDGSALLARHLPDDLAGQAADFGCGWGHLARVALARSPGIEGIDLIDAEYLALEAARANVADGRASFHWLDLASEAAPATYDAILCNPPFHTGRAATPSLGQKLIETAAHALRPGGRFYMVSNRGLPYEPLLKAHFASFETLADNNKFRVTRAIR